MPGDYQEPDRLNQSWSQVTPRYSDKSAISAQMIRYARGSLSPGKGWFGRIICQIVFILFFILPGSLFILMGLKSGWMGGLLGLVPTSIGLLLSYIIWKK